MNEKIFQSDDEFGLPVHIIEKNSKQQIRIGINEYRGKNYIDIRLFYRDGDKFLPSKKGVTLRMDLYFDFLRGIILLGESLGFDEEFLKKHLEE